MIVRICGMLNEFEKLKLVKCNNCAIIKPAASFSHTFSVLTVSSRYLEICKGHELTVFYNISLVHARNGKY